MRNDESEFKKDMGGNILDDRGWRRLKAALAEVLKELSETCTDKNGIISFSDKRKHYHGPALRLNIESERFTSAI